MIGAHNCFEGVVELCVGIEIVFVASCVVYFGIVRVGGDTFECVGFCGVCIVFLAVVLNSFDCIGGVVECVLVCSPSEVGMVTHYECCVNVCSEGSVGPVGIIPDVFACVTCWCVRGDICT